MTSHGLKLSQGLGPTVLATTWAECAASTALMVMRVYTNGFITKRWKADFWFATVTYVCHLLASSFCSQLMLSQIINVTGTIFLTVSVMFGLGEHLHTLVEKDPALITKNQFYQWIFTTFAIVGISLGKLTIIAFILQIEGSTTYGRKWVLYFFAVSIIIVNIIILPIIWTQCTPTAKIWDESIEGNCNGRRTNQLYGYFQGSFGAIMDVALALYPIFIFWSLKLQLHVKIGLMVLFGFGIVAAACSAVKTKQLSTVTGTSDLTYELASLDIWASTEMWVIFIVSCIPTIRPIFVKAFNKVYTSGSRTFATGQGYEQHTGTGAGTHSRAYATNLGTRKGTDSKATTLPTSNNESEENILPGQKGIMMTSHVVVKYDGSDSERGGRIEIGGIILMTLSEQ
ncbi:hypothetical protein D0Z07_7935 [Hyphodiscus hymeniophilus]|uniref:Rhodopsin domain-containing protein n=1 Tax=Hyphodiscus hymeniophilus TaxID=353542 RepID=A0A9P6SNM1_9HELO|nr:hypothetical protein D0Z07_7935 [Hyphodiscus hymeniophilus]